MSREPTRSYRSGPNYVLGWVLKQAWSLVSRLFNLAPESGGYVDRLSVAAQKLNQCRRLQGIGSIIADIDVTRRPPPNAILECGRSRRELYRLAHDAYREMLAVESGDPATIVNLLQHTLLGPLEAWRRFELYVGLTIVSAIAASSGEPMSLNLMIGSDRLLIGRTQRFGVYWQWRTDFYSPPEPEPSEVVTEAILQSYGLRPGGDRPDLVIADLEREAVVSIVEVKYLTGDDASDRIRSAVSQVVRYSRGYSPLAASKSLLENSLIVVSQGLDEDGLDSLGGRDGAPKLSDFSHLQRERLADWSSQLTGSVFERSLPNA